MKNQDSKTMKITKSTQNWLYNESKSSLPERPHLFYLLTLFLTLFSLSISAQTWSDQGNGTYLDRFTINDDNTDNWSQLRLQVSNNNGWNMINEGYLWWGYSNNGNHSDKGAEMMRLTQNGNLGIGVTHPDAKLDVAGDIRINDMYNLKSIGHLNLQADHDNSGDGNIYFKASNDVRMIMLDNGNFGIGTLSPTAKLEVTNGEVRFPGANGATNGFLTHFNFEGNESYGAGNYIRGNTYIADTGGNVGIGTSNPSAKLHIEAVDGSPNENGLYVYNPHNTTNKNAIIAARVAGESSGDPFVSWDVAGSGGWSMGIDNSDHNKLKIGAEWHGPSDKTVMTLDRGNRNVGIGTTNPTHKLEVSGTIKATSLISSARSFPDYVFAEDYNIQPLSELETYVKTYRHLPNMPAESEVVKNGLDVPEILTKSVENIETIYLHLIKMEKEITSLKKDNARLKAQIATKH